MPEPIEKWGAFAPLVKLVIEGKIDGFEVPHETLNYLRNEWPDGRPVARLQVKGAQLAFLEGAHRHYGYETTADFVRDGFNRIIKAKTPEGAISLGRCRLAPPNPMYLRVAPHDLHSTLLFVVQAGEEAEKTRAILQTAYPQARIELLEKAPDIATDFANSMGKGINLLGRLHELKPDQRKALTFLAFLAGATFVASVLNMFKLVVDGTETVIAVLFLIAFFKLIPRLRG